MSRGVVLIDGDYLLSNYEKMKNDGWIRASETVHHPGEVVWHRELSSIANRLRVEYYVHTGKGKCEVMRDCIAERCIYGKNATSTATPIVTCSPIKSTAIDFCVNALRYALENICTDIVLVSGDPDYLPLMEELKRLGMRVHARFFDCGTIDPRFHSIPDTFTPLERILFSGSPLPQK
ncbi:NYN domain-containing protein [bacterium]|nr:NYN domain-containing protein [bacterium]